jgi:uncharacterized protein
VAQKILSEASPYRLRVQRSGIHRLGVFAGSLIPKGRKVIEYAGERISRLETRKRFLEGSNNRSRRLNYLAQLDSYWAIDGAAGGNGAELINHSCDPNLKLKRIRRRLWLVSLRKIRRGEELAYDYHFARRGEKVRCRCGAKTCRGTINERWAGAFCWIIQWAAVRNSTTLRSGAFGARLESAASPMDWAGRWIAEFGETIALIEAEPRGYFQNMGALEMANSPKPVKSAKKLDAGKKLEKKTPLSRNTFLKRIV